MNLIIGKQIGLIYPGAPHPALQDVSFEIPQGRITLFMGKSGSGKTTLLRCIANLISDYTGDLLFEGHAVKNMSRADRAHSIGFVAQQFNLFPHMTVLENCLQPQELILHRSNDAALSKVRILLSSLGIEHLAQRTPNQLSGGQIQRVAIARALCMDAKTLLMDEPTSALDPESTAQLRDILKSLLQTGVSVVISTHDMSFAKSVFDRGYFLEAGRIHEESEERIKAYINT